MQKVQWCSKISKTTGWDGDKKYLNYLGCLLWCLHTCAPDLCRCLWHLSSAFPCYTNCVDPFHVISTILPSTAKVTEYLGMVERICSTGSGSHRIVKAGRPSQSPFLADSFLGLQTVTQLMGTGFSFWSLLPISWFPWVLASPAPCLPTHSPSLLSFSQGHI